MHRALNAVAVGLGLWREFGWQRTQPGTIAAGGGDDLRGRERLVHQRRFPKQREFKPAGNTANDPREVQP
jgi:hypothetical protein